MNGESRYVPLAKIASGGMATVHLGAAQGALGFEQLVALKVPHAHLVDDSEFRRSLLTEARLAARIHHANVVDVRDVEETAQGIVLVMDYVEGASVAELLSAWQRCGIRLPRSVALRIAIDAACGLDAVHSLRDEAGRCLGLVHRDVSPQNILIGLDGVARVTDFGIAKSNAEANPTTRGALKGKMGYLPPEAIRGEVLSARADVYSLGIVLWEMLSGRRLFRGETDGETLDKVLRQPVPQLGHGSPELTLLDGFLGRVLERRADRRIQSALEFGRELEHLGLKVASREEVAQAVEAAVGGSLAERRSDARARIAQLREERIRREGDEVVVRTVRPEATRGATTYLWPLAAAIGLAFGVASMWWNGGRSVGTRGTPHVEEPGVAARDSQLLRIMVPVETPPGAPIPAHGGSSSSPPPQVPTLHTVAPRETKSPPILVRPNPYRTP